MTRIKAALIHLGISAIIGVLVCILIFGIWYPWPIGVATGGMKLVYLMLGVDVVLGPLLTLIVFKTGKKTLKFDLTCIAIMQALALAYGLYTSAMARPAFIVLANDVYRVVTANDLNEQHLKEASRPEYRKISWFGPTLVAARSPTDHKQKQELVMAAMAMLDVHNFPKFYLPVNEEIDNLIAKAKPVDHLISKLPETKATLERVASKAKTSLADLVYAPMLGRLGDTELVALLSKSQKRYVGAIVATAPNP
jgi:hypothetical protein